ncbi:MAG: YdeI/OmpD-associated family protein [Gemmatimonadaceae bacterium]|nr:YdeI/OmpD-associated family protein [Gemmatimonadaceae bacterium]MCW5826333.1 YdeI/OmpD-associated family protein [Gemmatimonadaceae bacterium]
MPPVQVETSRIRPFPTPQAFQTWLSTHHASAPELWLRIYKKDSGVQTITYAEALDIALCYGWIDGIRKSYDATSFLQRFTPRRPKSVWSQVNRDHIARLIKEKRMTPHGLKQVEAAKQDGRWDAAYAPIRAATPGSLPKDLRAAIKANAKAERSFKTLTKMNIFALAYRTNAMRTPAGRERKIAALVAMLARGETITPQAKPAAKKK